MEIKNILNRNINIIFRFINVKLDDIPKDEIHKLFGGIKSAQLLTMPEEVIFVSPNFQVACILSKDRLQVTDMQIDINKSNIPELAIKIMETILKIPNSQLTAIGFNFSVVFPIENKIPVGRMIKEKFIKSTEAIEKSINMNLQSSSVNLNFVDAQKQFSIRIEPSTENEIFASMNLHTDTTLLPSVEDCKRNFSESYKTAIGNLKILFEESRHLT